MKCPICNAEDLRHTKDFICCYDCGEMLDKRGYAYCDECGEADMSVERSDEDTNLCEDCYDEIEKYINYPRYAR